jgi:hypothetical protein
MTRGAHDRVPPTRFTSGDLSNPTTLAAAARSVCYGLEVILLLVDARYASWAFTFVQGAHQRLGYSNFLLTSPSQKDCSLLADMWRRFNETPPACGWASEVSGNAAWLRWGRRAQRRGSMLDMHKAFAQRWKVAAQLLDLRYNVLVLDLDGLLVADIYPLLHSPLITRYAVVIQEESKGLNCGFVYFNSHAPFGTPSCAQSSSWVSPVRRPLLGVIKQGSSCRSTASWMAHAIYERIMYVAEKDPTGIDEGALWEQSVWNDVLISLETDSDSYPNIFEAVSPRRRREVFGNFTSAQSAAKKYIGLHQRSRTSYDSPLPPPDGERGLAFHRSFRTRTPLTTMPLCAPQHVRIFRKRPKTRPCLASGELLIAPPWLLARGSQPEIDWTVAQPPPVAYAHLVNMWRCFGSDCYSRANRLWWLRATGVWDRRLDDAGLTPGGPLWDAHTRVLVLSTATVSNMRSFLDLNKVLHDLVVAASLTGRTPVMPTLPCSFLQSDAPQHKAFIHGVPWSDVLAVGPPDQARCYPYPGGMNNAPHCGYAEVMHGFDFSYFKKVVAAEDVAMGAPRVGTRRRWPRLQLSSLVEHEPGVKRATALCEAQYSLGTARIAVLEDAGAADHLLMQDVNLTAILGGSDDVIRMLDASNVAPQVLVNACPYLSNWKRMRLRCPGYLIRSDDALDRALLSSPGVSRTTPVASNVGGRWIEKQGSVGFCAPTVENKGDCSKDTRGQMTLRTDQVTSWSRALTACMRRCSRCANCHFISISLAYKDCSWYQQCDLRHLRRDVDGFKTFPAAEPTVRGLSRRFV